MNTSLPTEPPAPATLSFDSSEVEVRAYPSYRTLAIAWIVIATVLRMVLVAPLPLGNGEAYYYSWSRFLDWSYYDHPPLVSWMSWATTLLSVSPVAVRLGPIVSAGLFGFLLYVLAERLFRPRAAFLALVLVTALPVFLFSSFVLNPEAPLAPLWMGYLLTIETMRRREEAYWPLLAGALLGVAFLAKYTALLLVPATLLYFALSAPMRHWLRRPSFYAGGAVAFVFALPVLVWNLVRGWPSLQLHLVERAHVAGPVAGENTISQLVQVSSSTGIAPLQSFLRLMVAQLFAYSPFLFPLLVVALVYCLRHARRNDRDLFLTTFSWPVLLVVLTAMSLVSDPEPHWSMLAFAPAAVAAGGYADELWSRSGILWKMGKAGVVLSGVAFLAVNIHARSDAILRWMPAGYDARADITNELTGWKQVRAAVMDVVHKTPGQVVLASNHYSLCGRLLFEMGDEPQVYCPTERRSAYHFLGRDEPPPDATVLALTSDIHKDLPAWAAGRSCVMADRIAVERSGRTVAGYKVYSCAPASTAALQTNTTSTK